MKCDGEHPDPQSVKWLFCRDCGFWVDGVYARPATDDVLRGQLAQYIGAPVELHATLEVA